MSILYILLGIFIFLLLLELFFFSKTAYTTGAFHVILKFVYKPGLIKFEKPKIKEKESFWVFFIALILCIGIILGEFFMNPSKTGIINYLGAAITLSGGIIHFFAKKDLGKFFSCRIVVHKKQKIIKTGLYKKIRHPCYFSDLILLIGLSLALSSYFGLVFIFVLFLPAVLFRISKEEEMFISNSKTEYLKYMDSTKKLIPYVY